MDDCGFGVFVYKGKFLVVLQFCECCLEMCILNG